MPKSNTWPGGIGLDTVTGMDSAGSCDSVVSAHSGFSDDSLEHLSAEERACLMFLEETIESLETEEDSGLSNDEPDLTDSMRRSTLNSSLKDAPTEPPKKNNTTKPPHSYLVPTPCVVANSSPSGAVPAKSDLPPHKNLRTPWAATAGVLVRPPPMTPRDQYIGAAERPRGPLSYDALVHLRRSASTKNTLLCHTVDHSINAIMEEPQPNLSRSHSEAFKPKTGPPVVLPKPKWVPVLPQHGISSHCSFTVRRVTDAEVIRQEALQKLGLVKEAQVAPESPPKSHKPAANKHVKATFNISPSRSPSFCHCQGSTQLKTRPLQSSASFHHHDVRHEQHAAHVNRLKTSVLECCATVDSTRPVPPKPSNSVGHMVMVVPGMGTDRKEALRKLGLLQEPDK